MSTLLVLFKLYSTAFFKENPDLLENCGHNIYCTSAASSAAVDSQETNEVQQKHAELVEKMTQYNILQEMEEFDKTQKSPSFKMARSYMDSVLTLLLFTRATRQGLWTLHLASLEKLCQLFFARDRIKYAQMVPGYILQSERI